MELAEISDILVIPELPDYIGQVDRTLKDLLAKTNPALGQPALRMVLAGGKRLRPSLVIAAAVSQGGKVSESVISAAASIELLHIASLVHDDIIDRANLRRGVATINSKEGVSRAVLVGDHLIALAAAQSATINCEIAYTVARAFAMMCEGQSQEITSTYNSERSLDDYLDTVHKKTAVLMSAACQVGGLCANLTPAQIDALSRYGAAFGTAFQLVDDLQDFLSFRSSQGKPVERDMEAGVYTMPLLLALQGPDAAQVRTWLGKKPAHKPTHETVVNILFSGGYVEKTVKEAYRYNSLATGALSELRASKVVLGLRSLPGIYLSRSLPEHAVPATRR